MFKKVTRAHTCNPSKTLESPPGLPKSFSASLLLPCPLPPLRLLTKDFFRSTHLTQLENILCCHNQHVTVNILCGLVCGLPRVILHTPRVDVSSPLGELLPMFHRGTFPPLEPGPLGLFWADLPVGVVPQASASCLLFLCPDSG